MALWVAGVILVLLPGFKAAGYVDYEDLSEEEDEDYTSYDVVDEEELMTPSPLATNSDDVTNNRIRRGQVEETAPTRTPSPEDLSVVKGALNQLLSGADNAFTPLPSTTSLDYHLSSEENDTTSTETPTYTIPDTPTYYDSSAPSLLYPTNTKKEDLVSIIKLMDDNDDTRSSKWHRLKSSLEKLSSISALRDGDILESSTASSNFTNSTTKREKSPQIDIPKLLELISELAKDFESNLTRKLNESIIGMSMPTCTTPTPPTTTERTTVTDEYDANYTGAIVAKCFVCGLDIPGIPQHAHCADAFAGDFLPLVPVDTSAKGKISSFRKYCKYANIRGYRTKSPQSRVVVGRWTGGCAVRWIDLSGVYTQRTCRNRMAPTMGQHFASKRMAKLERALWNVEDGCITSPVASLTPLSRGISLYARFHACVCSGSWCNTARLTRAPSYCATVSAAAMSMRLLQAIRFKSL